MSKKWPKSKTKGGFIKGERKEKDNRGTLNEITNVLPTHPHRNDLSNRVVLGGRRENLFDDRYDSGEEENNNLVKGHQDIDKYLWQTGGWTEVSLSLF